jgi:hypothetical protein
MKKTMDGILQSPIEIATIVVVSSGNNYAQAFAHERMSGMVYRQGAKNKGISHISKKNVFYPQKEGRKIVRMTHDACEQSITS